MTSRTRGLGGPTVLFGGADSGVVVTRTGRH
ncbi:Uncharacterised protein [Actinomyces viscosus]|uniref:Uncharacterized protein n=1 Tax=Actinomyces viscosus TaxID=1656 RepID=A0A448PMA7_ACTVI|nr:Uncharacterised protein [Actinomyces viscosus]